MTSNFFPLTKGKSQASLLQSKTVFPTPNVRFECILLMTLLLLCQAVVQGALKCLHVIFQPMRTWLLCLLKAGVSHCMVLGPHSRQNSPWKACCSVTQSCLILCDAMDCSTPGLLGRPRSRSIWFSENCLKSIQMGKGHFYYPRKHIDRPQDTEMVTFYNPVVC